MADSLNILNEVILKLEKSGKLSICENSYIKQLDPTLTDISADFEFSNSTFSGRGVAADPNLALKKAVYEVVERACFSKSKFKNTNGFAISESRWQAEQFAINELVEREIFLRHWNQERSFIGFNNDQTDALKRRFNSIYPHEIEITFFKSEITFDKNNLFICKISGLKYEQTFGFYFGFAYKSTQKDSINHCFFEAVNTFSYDYENNLLAENISLEMFMMKRELSFRDHGLLAKNVAYALRVDTVYFKRLVDFRLEDFKLKLDDFILINIDVLFELPLFCVKAVRNDFLNFQIGSSDESVLPHPID